jgi:hypothetical protein
MLSCYLHVRFAVRRKSCSKGVVGTGAVLMLLGCASRMPEGARLTEQHTPVERRLLVEQPTRLVEREQIRLPVPDGYYDASAEAPGANIVLVLAAKESSKGYRPTITIMKAPLPGGTFADPATCAETGRGFVTGGTDAPGTGGVLKNAQVIDGPVGKACQIHLVAPQGVAIITELDGPGNTPLTPQDVWLMTCNHAEGDDVAEARCRAALAGFRFRIR